MHTFETPEPITLLIRSGAGHVTVTAGETVRTTVELTPLNAAGDDAVAEGRVEQRGHSVQVELPRSRTGLFRPHAEVGVAVSCPTGSTVEVRTDSADVRITGALTDAVVNTGSGQVAVETVTGSARLKSGSGTVAAGQVGETLVVSTGSGDITVDRSGRTAVLTVGSGDISIRDVAGEVVTKSGSGDVAVERLGGTLVTKSGSGDLVVRRAANGSIKATGASGSITIGIDRGTAAWLDVSTLTGRVSQELDESEAPGEEQRRVEVIARTVSGDLRVHRS